MSSRAGQPWIPSEKIQELLQLEPALILFGLCAIAWAAYKLLLSRVSSERHKNLRALFTNLAFHLSLMSTLLVAHFGMNKFAEDSSHLGWLKAASYVGLFTLISGATVFVKVSRILVSEYLFLKSMRTAVPLLLINIITLLISLTIGTWLLSELFSIRLGPLLATSAAFSIVLGLALQDTLGNLFAGITIQFDKPYEIGDWIEIQTGPQKWVGQVQEISWRATVLLGLSDESVTIPNRIIAQAHIANFATRVRPIVRSQLFRISYDSSVELAKSVLSKTIDEIPEALKNPAPLILVSEVGEHWVSLKLVYCVNDYGMQFIVADRILELALAQLQRAGIRLASPRFELTATQPLLQPPH